MKKPVQSLPPPACPPAPVPHIKPEDRDASGRFKAGSAGRKAGALGRSKAIIDGVEALGPDALAVLGTMVRQGVWPAVKLVLDYCLPKDGRPIDLGGKSDPHDLIEAATTGIINPTEFAKLAVGFKSALDAAELQTLKNQVDELEALVKALKP